MAQVSMNLVDWERTGIAAVVHEVMSHHPRAGAAVSHADIRAVLAAAY